MECKPLKIKKESVHTIRLIGGNIAHMRKSRGISQQAIANLLDVSFQQLQKYENGTNRISADKLHVLKLYFKVRYRDFFIGL